MKTKREESILDIITTFEEMADLILIQLTLLEKYMTGEDVAERQNIISELIKNEDKIDKYEILVSDKFINSIVLYQPVASDIRRIVAIYRMTINLERIGDRVMNVLHSLRNIQDTEEYKALADVISVMLVSGITMVEKSLLSFINSDNEYAVWTIKNDEVIDEMNHKLLSNSISKANVNAKTKEMLLSYIDLKDIITNLERIADHATNIAEASIYSIQGTDIRHMGSEAINTNDENAK